MKSWYVSCVRMLSSNPDRSKDVAYSNNAICLGCNNCIKVFQWIRDISYLIYLAPILPFNGSKNGTLLDFLSFQCPQSRETKFEQLDIKLALFFACATDNYIDNHFRPSYAHGLFNWWNHYTIITGWGMNRNLTYHTLPHHGLSIAPCEFCETMENTNIHILK